MNRPDSNMLLFIFNFSFIIALSTMSNIRFHLLTTQDANDAESPNFVPVILS
jgi:hypothetical protein